MLCHESDFIVFIGWLRKELGLNRSELAAEVGVPLASLQRWQNGNYKPNYAAMLKLGLYCARMVQEGKLVIPMPLPWNSEISSTLIETSGFVSTRPVKPRNTPLEVNQRRRKWNQNFQEFLRL